jgi:hypothetical protein
MATLSVLLKPQIRFIKLQAMVKLMLACEDRKYGVNVRYVRDPSRQTLYFEPVRTGRAGAYQKYGVIFTPVGVKRTVACPSGVAVEGSKIMNGTEQFVVRTKDYTLAITRERAVEVFFLVTQTLLLSEVCCDL